MFCNIELLHGGKDKKKHFTTVHFKTFHYCKGPCHTSLSDPVCQDSPFIFCASEFVLSLWCLFRAFFKKSRRSTRNLGMFINNVSLVENRKTVYRRKYYMLYIRSPICNMIMLFVDKQAQISHVPKKCSWHATRHVCKRSPKPSGFLSLVVCFCPLSFPCFPPTVFCLPSQKFKCRKKYLPKQKWEENDLFR